MQALAQDEEQVAFWQRHTRLGVALCVVLPAMTALHTWASASPPHPRAVYALAAVVALSAPLLLLVPVPRLVRHARGRLFFDAWEAAGIGLVVAFALLDGGADSPFVMIFYVLLAHAALAYPPVGMLLAGAGNVLGYLLVAALGGGAAPMELLTGTLTMLVATGTCAFASYNHVRLYERTAAFARQIAVLAARDGLTGCLNHRTFHERLQAESSIVDEGHPLSLLLIDVDDFKSVNDSHGHPAGDAVLQAIGRTLLELSRESDAAGRLGGDEFALLLPSTSSVTARMVAERVREQVSAGTGRYRATVSVGVATTTARAAGAGLLAAADRAVYQAKRGGRDRVASNDALDVPAARRAFA